MPPRMPNEYELGLNPVDCNPERDMPQEKLQMWRRCAVHLLGHQKEEKYGEYRGKDINHHVSPWVTNPAFFTSSAGELFEVSYRLSSLKPLEPEDIVDEILPYGGYNIIKVTMKLGDLAGVVPDQERTIYELGDRGSPLYMSGPTVDSAGNGPRQHQTMLDTIDLITA